MGDTQVFVRFENVHTDKMRMMGPYPFVQLTYETLRYGPDGDDLAYFDRHNGTWWMIDGLSEWTDIIIAPPNS